MLEIKEGTSLQWNMPSFDGPVPSVRESHSTLTWGNKLIMYGGMNGRRLGDVWILDVTEWKWSAVSPQGTVPVPLPRRHPIYSHCLSSSSQTKD